MVLALLLAAAASSWRRDARAQELAPIELRGGERGPTGSSPNDLVSRVEIRDDLVDERSAGFRNAAIVEADAAVARGLVLGGLVPWVAIGGGDEPRASGLGDVAARVAVRIHSTDRLALVATGTAFFDTARARGLGVGASRLLGTVAVVYVPREDLELGLIVEHRGDLAEPDEARPAHATALRPILLADLPAHWWVFVDPRVEVAHGEAALRGTFAVEVGHKLDLGVRLFGAPGFEWFETTIAAWTFRGGARWIF